MEAIRLKIRLLIGIAAGLLLAAGPAAALTGSGEGAQHFEGFKLQGYSQTGDRLWDVFGDTADVMGETIKITNVDGNYYGQEEMNVTSRFGYLTKSTGDVRLEEDVVVTAERGGRMLTDSINWEKAADLVTSRDLVKFIDESMYAEGTGLRARPGLKTARLNRDVTVRVRTEPENAQSEEVVITSDGPLEIFQLKNLAVFNDNVVAVQTDRTLKADRMEIYFNPETRQIEKSVCIGNVVIIQGDNETHSERAVYTAADEKLKLEGRPKLKVNPETMGRGGV